MSESTADTEKELTCPRCKTVVDKSSALWTVKINCEELESVHVCQECWKILDAVREKIDRARNSFLQMVYEYPGHEKQAPGVVGHVVMTVRLSKEEELAKFGWEDSRTTDVLVLSSGAIIIASEDEEWNDVGALCCIDNKGNTYEF